MKDGFPFKKLHYWLIYRAAEYFLRAIIFLVPRIPRPLLVVVKSATVRLTFAILWPYRKVMEQNVSMVVSHRLSAGERKTLVRTGWRNFVQGLFETVDILDTSSDVTRANIAVKGEEHLQQALEKRSEERRVGKEWRVPRSPDHVEKKPGSYERARIIHRTVDG